jgi:hypothetical protein
MPPPIESAYFREQRPRCHALEAKLAVEILAITNITKGTAVGTAVGKSVENKVHQLAQAADITATKAKVYSRAIEKTEWFLYICASKTADTQVLLLVGKPVPAGVVFPYFDWVLSAEDRTALNGDWDPQGLTNAVDMTFTGNLIYAHDDKHFNPNKKDEAQYTIGNTQNRKKIVAGMEKKAIEHGFGSGERFFRFSVVVGTDPVNTTCSIRVDTPGGPSQHSHPIPESGAGEVNHDRKVITGIAYCTRERQLDQLVSLAKYLKLIGTANNAFSNLKNKLGAEMWGGLRPPACKYWSW